MYHDVYNADTAESGFQSKSALIYKIKSREFEKQVELASKYCKNKNISKASINFTFDDGGVSFYTICAPILEKYGFFGVFFIATKFIGTKGFLNENQIRELHRRGHIIGSHSHSHLEIMSSLSKEMIDFEWSESIKILEGIIKSPIEIASIPNGYSSKYVVESARKKGIQFLFTSKPSTSIKLNGTMQIVGRYVIMANQSNEYVLSLIQSSLTRAKLSMRWFILGIAKAVLGKAYLRIRKSLIK